MIIGTTGWGGVFVCSETHYLPHMNLRGGFGGGNCRLVDGATIEDGLDRG